MRISIKNLALVACTIVLTVATTGCDRRTPDERLSAAGEFLKQGDQLSAEMEALKVVEKAPEDPASVQASIMLAQIYAGQNRFDEAEMQMQAALENVSQLEPMGKEVLRMYLELLNGQKKYDEALKTIEKYQQEYAEDPGTSLSLTMAGIQTQTMAGQTTTARETLGYIIEHTTTSEELAIYRPMYVQTFLRDENTTAAIAYLEVHLPSIQRPQDRLENLIGLASLYRAQDNYGKSRFYLESFTDIFMDSLRQEVDVRGKIAGVLQLGQMYLGLGNLPGGRRVYETLYATNPTDPDVLVATVNGLTQTLMRSGETSETQTLLRDVSKKYPDAPFAAQLKRLEDLVGKGELQQLEPMDTSTLAMKYKEDPNVLWPADLPEALGMETTGTVTDDTAATGTLTVDTEATETVTGDTATTETTTTEPVTTGTDPLTTSSGRALPPLASRSNSFNPRVALLPRHAQIHPI